MSAIANQQDLPASPTTAQPLPTNQDFATEVRIDRLAVIWKVTLVGCAVVGWIIATLVGIQRSELSPWLVVLLPMALGCVLTRTFLHINRYTLAVWSFTTGIVIGIAAALARGDALAVQIIPFAFPLLIFVVGLLLPSSSTFFLSVIATVIILGVPAATTGGWGVATTHQIVAVCLTFASALLAAQVTGELYQLTEWAMLNYQKEVRTATELLENRLMLERTLRRTQVLSEELQETNAELEVAKHFRGQFLANMSHELRTPLNAIIGFSETMLKFPEMYDGLNLPKPYEQDLNQIFTSGRQLLNLINDILDLSRVDAGKLEIHMQRVDLEPVIQTVLSTAAGLVGNKSIKLEKDLPSPLPIIWADPQRVRQVLLNLYSNAAKFTDEGSITLAVREIDEGVRISIKDTGSGVEAKNMEIIFEEFKQAESAGRDPRAGAGLGLAIARQLLNLMGGRIWVESVRGHGSTFHFIVQPYQAQDGGNAPPQRPQTGSLGQVRTVPAQVAAVKPAEQEVR